MYYSTLFITEQVHGSLHLWYSCSNQLKTFKSEIDYLVWIRGCWSSLDEQPHIPRCHYCIVSMGVSLQWRHNGCDSVSNHQIHACLLNCLFRGRWKKTSKLRVTVLCVGNSPLIGEFPAQMVSNAKNSSIWWRHLVMKWCIQWLSLMSENHA